MSEALIKSLRDPANSGIQCKFLVLHAADRIEELMKEKQQLLEIGRKLSDENWRLKEQTEGKGNAP